MGKISIDEGMNLIQFRRLVREYYLPWYEKNDLAHDITHADKVCDMGLEICNDFQYNSREEKMDIILASYIHDIFTSNNRKNHAELASDYILRWYQHDDPFLSSLSAGRLYYLAQAVLEHRASYKGQRTHPLSKLLSMADRGRPNLEDTIKRSMDYNKGNAREVLAHMKDKFGTDGYCSYPEEYLNMFKTVLVEFVMQIDALTISKIESIHFKT